MRFADILHDGRLWAIVYDGDTQDILTKTFTDWQDPAFLEDFFSKNITDLKTYFNISDPDLAISDTVADTASLSSLILDITPETRLHRLFRPLGNSLNREMRLSREQAKCRRTTAHESWLRIYAIKIKRGTYLITGGAIKLTPHMEERKHTLDELRKMEMAKNNLLNTNKG